MQPGERVCLLDGTGYEYVVTLTALGKDDVKGEIIEKRQGTSEPACQITLYLSLLNKADKFEWALQKCTEVGAAAFVPVRAARSVSDVPGTGKVERWERIIQEAAEQSGRAVIPALGKTLTLAQAFDVEAARLRESTSGKQIAIMPALGATRSMSETLREAEPESISIIVGPEGGFTGEEMQAAESAGILLVTLGARTLRAETAAVVALTMALYELGEMGR